MLVATAVTVFLAASRIAAQGTTAARIQDRFNRGRLLETELLGSWVLVAHAMTSEFARGTRGADRVLANPNGIAREIDSRRVLEWQLNIGRVSGNRLRVASSAVWGPPGDCPVELDQNELRFEQEYGGDSRWVYRCRTESSELVCVLRGHESGHGVVFRKTKSAG